MIGFFSFLKHSLPSFLSPALFWVPGSVPFFKNYYTGERYSGEEYSGEELTLAITSPRDSYLSLSAFCMERVGQNSLMHPL